MGTPLDGSHPCRLPGHNGHTGKFWRDRRDFWVYRCGSNGFALAEVYAAMVAGEPWFKHSGETWRPKGPELVVWKLRMLGDLGLLEVDPFPLKQPSRPLGPNDRAAWRAVEMLFAIRGIAGMAYGTPLTRKFLARWLGLSLGTAERIKQELIGAGAIIEADRAPGKFGPMAVWRPVARELASGTGDDNPNAVAFRDGVLSWRDAPSPGQDGLLADAQALVDAGLAKWVGEEQTGGT